MSAVIAEPPPPTPSTVKGDVAIPEVSSSGGAQGARPAPAGTIPPRMQPYSDRPESAKSKSFQRLRDRVAANDKAATTPAPAAKVDPATPKPDAEPEVDEPEVEPEEPEVDPNHDPELDALVDSDKKVKLDADGKAKVEKKKENPWHLLKAEKAAKAKYEAEIAELRKSVVNPEARKSEVAELAALRKERDELMNTIRFKDYEQHPEFKEKYDKPYKDQWKFSIRTLNGITKISEDGSRVAAVDQTELANDLLELVNMPTSKAIERAEEIFGDAATYVMHERNKIKEQFDKRNEALEGNRAEGAQKEEARIKQERQKAEALSSELKTIYDKANEYHSKDARMKEFFQPIEGDEEANSILENGYKMVDEAFQRSPMDPSLSEKERASLVKKHAAVRHRSAGFGRAKYLLAKERAVTAALREKLAQYESTVPGRQPSRGAAPAINTGGSKLEQMQARLRERASK
jgi:hypothetical protein